MRKYLEKVGVSRPVLMLSSLIVGVMSVVTYIGIGPSMESNWQDVLSLVFQGGLGLLATVVLALIFHIQEVKDNDPMVRREALTVIRRTIRLPFLLLCIVIFSSFVQIPFDNIKYVQSIFFSFVVFVFGYNLLVVWKIIDARLESPSPSPSIPLSQDSIPSTRHKGCEQFTIALIFFGIATGLLLGIVAHELGHAAVGYTLNKESIKEINFFSIPPRVTLSGDYLTLFGPTGASLLLLGSIAAELVLLVSTLAVLRSVKDSLKDSMSWFFLLGFYLGLAHIMVGWSGLHKVLTGADWRVLSGTVDAWRIININPGLKYPVYGGMIAIVILYLRGLVYIFADTIKELAYRVRNRN